jgi:hypothetical protein
MTVRFSGNGSFFWENFWGKESRQRLEFVSLPALMFVGGR